MAVPATGNLASPGLRVVQGLIDLIILGVINGIIRLIFQNATGVAGLIDLILDLAYWGYFLSQRGQSVGMMVFNMHCRNVQTGQNPDVGRAVLRGFIWHLEIIFTVCIVGLVGWLWMFWDPQRQGWHDKAAGTIVTEG
ncbi:MAG TPA: RDD family protein [Candidatus Dormibacteraeota bacterium]|nr:RDD family protein [Candidatus Dormibacteraeota bacterium]